MGEVSIVSLWKQFKTHGCTESRDMIILRYAHLVSITAGRLHRPMPAGVERDDLQSAGMLGLIKAVDQFDPERKIKFETYAITLIRGAILEMMRADDWVPRLVRDQQKQYAQANTRLEGQLGRHATEAETATEMGISPEKMDQMASTMSRSFLQSLDDVRLSGEQLRVIDTVPTAEPSPMDCLVVRDRHRALVTAVDQLPDRERLVLGLYYTESFTFKEIGEALTVSESRAYQLHSQAVARMGKFLRVEQELFQ